MATEYERQKRYMDNKKARGFVKPAIWVHESKRDELIEAAHNLNQEAIAEQEALAEQPEREYPE